MIYTKEELLSRTIADGDCLLWQGAKAGKGYAVVSDERERYVHRLMLILEGQTLLPKKQVAHSCGRPACINPGHLSQKTQSENEADKLAHGTYLHGKPGESHCGRYLTPELGPRSKRCKTASGHTGPCKPDIFAATYEEA